MPAKALVLGLLLVLPFLGLEMSPLPGDWFISSGIWGFFGVLFLGYHFNTIKRLRFGKPIRMVRLASKSEDGTAENTATRAPRNMGLQATVNAITSGGKIQFIRSAPGKPQGALPIVIDIEELVGSPIENTFDWTIQVQNVVIFTRDADPITCRVYLTGDCGSYRAKAEAKSDYVLGSPITITGEAQSGTFVFQLMERIRGAGPVNSPNRLWGDLELAFLEVGTDRSLYIPFAVTQSVPDTEDSPTPRAE